MQSVFNQLNGVIINYLKEKLKYFAKFFSNNQSSTNIVMYICQYIFSNCFFKTL